MYIRSIVFDCYLNYVGKYVQYTVSVIMFRWGVVIADSVL